MVAIVIFWPGLVTAFVDNEPKIDPSQVEIIIPTPEPGEALPGFGPPGADPRQGGRPSGAEGSANDALEDQFRRSR